MFEINRQYIVKRLGKVCESLHDKMSTLIEDPGIPLVGMNGHQKYKTLNESTSEGGSKRFETVGKRLARRKVLFAKRKHACDASLVLALAGILIMVLETELAAAGVFTRDSIKSHIVKMCITATTVALLIFLGIYHYLNIELFLVDNSIEDKRIALSSDRVIQIFIEFLVCIIHPFPGNFKITWQATIAEGQTARDIVVPLDVILSLPMFLRLYLVCRSVLLHSKLYQDASSQSLGALNRIHFNFRFIFKSFMAVHPDYILALIMMLSFLMASWALRLCEMHVGNDIVHSNYLNSMWLIAITFLSVGYGDIVPITYCGRSIAVLTGIMGAGCTALVVAVLARKLELSRSEKYVHDYVIDISLDKQLKHEAANVMKAGWFVYKFKKLRDDSGGCLKHQRKLLKAIYNIREIKAAQRRLLDASVTLVEMNKSQVDTTKSVELIRMRQVTLEEKVDNLETKIIGVHEKLNAIYNAVSSRTTEA